MWSRVFIIVKTKTLGSVIPKKNPKTQEKLKKINLLPYDKLIITIFYVIFLVFLGIIFVLLWILF